jgi:ankyrin repeat protein
MELDLEQARRRAKERLRAARRGELVLRDDREPRLADAQRSVANELGFASWPALVAHVEATGGDRADRAARLVREALAGRADRTEALLAADPGLARPAPASAASPAAGAGSPAGGATPPGDLAVALVLGDADTVARALAADPGLVSRELPGAGRRPLTCACHSAFLAPDQPRAPGMRRVVELLLDAGADPNETFDNEYGAMPALYGAAGVAHDPQTTRLLLDRGANPDDGESVYHSVEAESTECLEILLERGATVRETNALGNAQRRPDMQRLLLERGDLRPSDPELRNALLWARGEESARLLIAHGADLEARDRDGLTPYSNAARRGDEALMAVLAEAGADTQADPVALWLGALVRGEPAARPAGATLRRADAELLPRFASAGRDDVVERLLEAGVPLHARGIDEGTALHYAGMWGRGSTVELLLARGAEPNLMAGPPEHPSNALGWTAFGSRELYEAGDRVEGYVAAARSLIAAGASVSEGMADIAADDVAVLLEEAEQRDERLYEVSEVLMRVRCRGGRCEIDDRGWAVDAGGRPPGWHEVAERAAAGLGWSVSRSGRVLVAVAADRDIEDLVRRTADAALAVRDALLALEE